MIEYADLLESQHADSGQCPTCLEDIDSGRCECTKEQQADGYQGCTCCGENCTC